MDSSTNNPFPDPNQGTFQTYPPTANVTGLDDYDPFRGRPSAVTPPPQPLQTIAPPQSSVNIGATTQPGLGDPPSYQPAAAQQVDTTELQRRQEELERKAAELEQELETKRAEADRANNCPPLPERCCVKPCFRQDFETDIPVEFRRVAKTIFFSYILRTIVLTLNFLFSIGYLALAPHDTGAAGRTLGLSFFHLLWWILMGFLCWQRPSYSALRSDSALSYFWFLFVTAWNILVDIFMILGPLGTGYLGILTGATLLGDKYDGQEVRNMGGVTMIIVIGSVALLALDIYLIVMVHRYYRRSGVTMQQAQSEFQSGAWRNQYVQAAGAQAVSGAASGVMAGAGSNVAVSTVTVSVQN